MAGKDKKSGKKGWVIILASLADDVVILAVIIGIIWYFNIKLPLWLMIVIGLALGAFIFVRTWAVLPSLRRKHVIGAEAMIGQECEVVQPLTPNGVVRVGVEYWQATSLEGEIESGEEVEIFRVDRLKLEVRRKSL